jgi:hypothetical protein
LVAALEHRNAAAAAAGFNGGHEARGAGAEDENVEAVWMHDADMDRGTKAKVDELWEKLGL